MSGQAILAVNAGSSSLKFALYPCSGSEIGPARLSGTVEGLEPGGRPCMRIKGDTVELRQPIVVAGDGAPFDAALKAVQAALEHHAAGMRMAAVAHRIVHGGERLLRSVRLDEEALHYLDSRAPLAPLHQPHNLAGVRAFAGRYPDLPQIGCFDTAFHASLPQLETLYALPRALREQGIRRYGFHGLSYQYVCAELKAHSGRADGRMVLAHLGNGASACAVRDGKSVATTMGFSALDGLVMGTRSGSLDPGVLLYLMQRGWSAERLEQLLYRECGLRGVSGISADMRTLRASEAPEAKLAIDLFIHRLVRECGALAACLQGLDLIAFTGGIGEHDAALRARTCDALAWLGVRIDRAANAAADGSAAAPVHAAGSGVEIWVVPTDEGRVAAAEAARLIALASGARG
ncbi:MAG TPA: acetate/propionate family kinase [Noviherbaspirillum sp.]|nr:acetate/propionate family kinase [Noviherbaspirillum sp.]